MAMNSTRRKLAIATWSAPSEGNIYGKLDIDAEELLAFIDHVRATTGTKVTVTHVVGKAVADAMADAPDLNGRIYMGRYVPHKTVDVTFLVALEGGSDLAKAKIDNTDKKSVGEIAEALNAVAGRLRAGKDTDFEKTKNTVRMLPTWVLRRMLKIVGWLSAAAGLSIPALGVEPFPFGSAVITSVGMFGLDEAFAPPTPFARVPVLVLVGAVKPRPAVVGDDVVVRKMFTITATMDHRFIDGGPGARVAMKVKDILENPWQLIGLTGAPS